MHIVPPWDWDTVDALNAFQLCGRYHPFTCPQAHPDRDLKATPQGWVCRHCDYVQNWATDGMVVLGKAAARGE